MSRLTSISIQRFRGIRTGEIKDFADVNLLIGRNNSGKSTVAEAISSALFELGSGYGVDPISRQPPIIWRNLRRDQGPPAPETWYRQDQAQSLVVQLALATGESKINWEWGFKMEAGSPHVIKSASPSIVANPLDPAVQFARRHTVFRPPDALNRDIENKLWPKLLASRLDKPLTATINAVFNMGIESLQLLPDQRLIVLFPNYSVPIDVLGDGARSTLRCMIMLAFLDGALLTLEEPECHQHPGSLERFALALCRQAKAQNVQLLISTHSAECVRSFIHGAAEAKTSSAVFHLKLTDGVLESTRLGPDALETLRATGVDVRFLDLYG